MSLQQGSLSGADKVKSGRTEVISLAEESMMVLDRGNSKFSLPRELLLKRVLD